jgi:hypothetical protein
MLEPNRWAWRPQEGPQQYAISDEPMVRAGRRPVTRFRPPMRFSCREAGLAPWSGPRFRNRSRRWWPGFEVSRSNGPGGGQSSRDIECAQADGENPSEGLGQQPRCYNRSLLQQHLPGADMPLRANSAARHSSRRFSRSSSVDISCPLEEAPTRGACRARDVLTAIARYKAPLPAVSHQSFTIASFNEPPREVPHTPRLRSLSDILAEMAVQEKEP